MLTFLELEEKYYLLEIMDKYELIDVWREVYPEKRGYTWQKFNTVQQGRLDCFLVSEELMLDVNGVKINRATAHIIRSSF